MSSSAHSCHPAPRKVSSRSPDVERKATRERLALLGAILDSALDAVVLIDGEGTILEYGGNAERVLGYPAEQAVGRSIEELFIPARYRQAHQRALANAVAEGESRHMDLPALRPDGTELPAEITVSRLRLPGPARFVVFVRDVSLRRTAERRVEEYRRQRDRTPGGLTATRILLADEHEMLRGGLRALLERQPGVEVVAEASDGREALRKAQELEPDLVVMEISMPRLNGVDATRQITTLVPRAKVLCLSIHSDPELVEDVMEAGASGYQLKDGPIEELVQAIAAVTRGEIHYCPRIMSRMEREAMRTGKPHPTPPHLTSRERDVLQLIAEEHTNKEIARMLAISVKTVGAHREHLMKKLDIHSIAGLTKYAIRQGLTTAEQ